MRCSYGWCRALCRSADTRGDSHRRSIVASLYLATRDLPSGSNSSPSCHAHGRLFSLTAPSFPPSCDHLQRRWRSGGVFLKTHWRIGLYAVLLMTGFISSATARRTFIDFLQQQHSRHNRQHHRGDLQYRRHPREPHLWDSLRTHRRRRAIVAATMLSLPIIPLWAFGGSPLWFAVGAFLMQFMVQSAWGIVPVHLNELSPPEVRGTFPGFVYQLGNCSPPSTQRFNRLR